MSQAVQIDNAQQAPLNRLWAELMLEELTRFGIRHVCIAPGSRSTPLTLAAQSNDKLTIHPHFDERGLGFFALGLAKALQSPVAVIVTSGTAVANLLPAVAEAGLTKEKLVLLTSDRPTELIECGANQAIRQQGIFSQHVCSEIALPSPTLSIAPGWLLATLDQACESQRRDGGAVHINCPYPEPLYGEEVELSAYFSNYLSELPQWRDSNHPYVSMVATVDMQSSDPCAVLPVWSELINKKGVIVAGKLAADELCAVRQLAKQLGWPLLVDPQAGGSSEWAHFDLWLQSDACRDLFTQAEVLLQFGARLVSKRLGQFIAGHDWQAYWLIDPQHSRLDPYHRSLTRFVCPIQHLVSELRDASSELLIDSCESRVAGCELGVSSYELRESKAAKGKTPLMQGWADPLIAASERVRSLALSAMSHPEQLTEISFAASLDACVDAQTSLFIGNSLIVRLVDMFSRLPDMPVFTNRGASGIDGLIATAAGVQQGQQQPLLCLIGDTSLLYDLNSLALLSQTAHPCVVVVMNNDGGGIFDMLPVPEQQKDQLYRMPHGYEFSHAAAMFGLEYCRPETLSEAITAIRDGLKPSVNGGVGNSLMPVKQSRLIEIQTPAGEAGEQLKTLFAAVKDATLL